MQTVLIGTAQWGMDYGITNRAGRITDAELDTLSDLAFSCGYLSLDTAPAYGDSETRIGQLGRGFRVQTKVSASGCSKEDLNPSLESSMKALRQDRIWSVLVHDWSVLDAGERLRALEMLSDLQAAGGIERFGISIYDESDLVDLPEDLHGLEVIQVPASVLDQRMVSETVLSALRVRGVRIQARSIFLQGTLLDSDRVTAQARHPHVARLHESLRERGLSPAQASIDFIKRCEWIDEVVVGFAEPRQLREFADAWDREHSGIDWSPYASEDLALLDPRQW